MEIVEVRSKGTGIGHASRKKKADDDDKDTKHPFEPGRQYTMRSLLNNVLVQECANVDDWEHDALPTGGKSLIDWEKGEQVAHLGVLYVVLALIMVNGRALPDSKLLRVLFCPL